jgi:hypothetical protein
VNAKQIANIRSDTPLWHRLRGRVRITGYYPSDGSRRGLQLMALEGRRERFNCHDPAMLTLTKPEHVTTLTFPDFGQDFLRWKLDADGYVMESSPFQSSVWRGVRVTNHAKLKPGSVVRVRLHRSEYGHDTFTTMSYRCACVERAGTGA